MCSTRADDADRVLYGDSLIWALPGLGAPVHLKLGYYALLPEFSRI